MDTVLIKQVVLPKGWQCSPSSSQYILYLKLFSEALLTSSSPDFSSPSVQNVNFNPLVRLQPLLVIIIITAAKEEVA